MRQNNKKETIKYDDIKSIVLGIFDIVTGTHISFGNDIKRDAKKHNYPIAIVIFLIKLYIAIGLVTLICKFFNL